MFYARKKESALLTCVDFYSALAYFNFLLETFPYGEVMVQA